MEVHEEIKIAKITGSMCDPIRGQTQSNSKYALIAVSVTK